MCDEKIYYVYFISLNACEHEQAENIGTVKTKTEENAEFYAADLYGLPYDDLGETWFVSEHNMGKLFLIDDFPMSVIKYQKYRTKAAARALSENRITTPAPCFEEEKKMDKKKSLVEIFNEKRQTMDFKEAYIEAVKEIQADEFYKQYGRPVETVFTCGQIQEMAEYEFEAFLIRAAYGSIKDVTEEEDTNSICYGGTKEMENNMTTEIQSIYDTFGQKRTLKEVEELKNEGHEFENEAAVYRRAGFVMGAEDVFPGLNRDELTEIAFIESEDGELYSVDLPITDWSVVKERFEEVAARFRISDGCLKDITGGAQ